jgi:hypothetical protein
MRISVEPYLRKFNRANRRRKRNLAGEMRVVRTPLTRLQSENGKAAKAENRKIANCEFRISNFESSWVLL